MLETTEVPDAWKSKVVRVFTEHGLGLIEGKDAKDDDGSGAPVPVG